MHPTQGQVCYQCGGLVMSTTAAERTGSYRGQSGFQIPASLAIPTCQNCGAEWLDDEIIGALDEIFEKQYQMRRRIAATPQSVADVTGGIFSSWWVVTVATAFASVASSSDDYYDIVVGNPSVADKPQGKKSLIGPKFKLIAS